MRRSWDHCSRGSSTPGAQQQHTDAWDGYGTEDYYDDEAYDDDGGEGDSEEGDFHFNPVGSLQQQQPQLVAGAAALTARNYQYELLQHAIADNVIAFLPTGSGKTLIAVLLLKHMHEREQKLAAMPRSPWTLAPRQQQSSTPIRRFSVFVANKVHLVLQQSEVIRRHSGLRTVAFYGDHSNTVVNEDGSTSMVNRKAAIEDIEQWTERTRNLDVGVFTSGLLLELLSSGTLTISQFNLIVFDEVHESVKSHPMKLIMSQYYHPLLARELQHNGNGLALPKIFAMTASPTNGGADVLAHVKELEQTLNARVHRVSDHTEELHDVVPTAAIKLLYYTLPMRSRRMPNGPLYRILCDHGLRVFPQLLKPVLENDYRYFSEQCGLQVAEYYLMLTVDSLVDSLHDHNIRTLLTSDQIKTLAEVLKPAVEPWRDQLAASIQQSTISSKLASLIGGVLHEEATRGADLRAIVFVERRTMAKVLCRVLQLLCESDPWLHRLDIKPGYLTGHKGAEPGGASLSIEEQNQVLAKFRSGEVNVLISTSIAQEGLDVPACNVVAHFDFPKTLQSFVQSRGRARSASSSYYVLVDQASQAEMRQIKEYMANEVQAHRYIEDRVALTPSQVQSTLGKLALSSPEVFTVPGSTATLTPARAVAIVEKVCQSLPADAYEDMTPYYFVRDSVALDVQRFVPRGSRKRRRLTDAAECDYAHLLHRAKAAFEAYERQFGTAIPASDAKLMFQAVLILPTRVMPHQSEIVGIWCASNKDAKRDSAFKAAQEMHARGLLTDRFQPVKQTAKPASVKVDDEEVITVTESDAFTSKIFRKPFKCLPEGLIQAYMTRFFLSHSPAASVNRMAILTCRPIEMTEVWDDHDGVQIHARQEPLLFTQHQWKMIVVFNQMIRQHIVHAPKVQQRGPDAKKPFVTMQFVPIVTIDSDVQVDMDMVQMFVNASNGLSDVDWLWLFKHHFKYMDETVVQDARNGLKPYRLRALHAWDDFDIEHMPLHGRFLYNEDGTVSWPTEEEAAKAHLSRQGTGKERCSWYRIISKYHPLWHLSQTQDTHPQIVIEAVPMPTTPAEFYDDDDDDDEDDEEEFESGTRSRRDSGHGSSRKPSGASSTASLSGTHQQQSQDADPIYLIYHYCFVRLLPLPFTVFSAMQAFPRLIHRLSQHQTHLSLYKHMRVPVTFSHFRRCLTLPSAGSTDDYEVTEFVGDTVLQYLTSVHAFAKNPRAQEGQLSRTRGAATVNKFLTRVSRSLNVQHFLLSTRFSRKTWIEWYYGITKTQYVGKKTLADIVEAIIGASFIDYGEEAAYKTFLYFLEDVAQKYPTIEALYTTVINQYADDAERESTHVEKFPIAPGLDVQQLGRCIGYQFRSYSLGAEALTHPSYIPYSSYERLEWLGDAIVQIMAVNYIYRNYPGQTPYQYTEMRAVATSNMFMSMVAVHLGMHRVLACKNHLLAKAIDKFAQDLDTLGITPEKPWLDTPGRGDNGEVQYYRTIPIANISSLWEKLAPPKALGDLMESVIAAVWIDSGCDTECVQRLYLRMFEPYLPHYVSPDTVARNPLYAIYQVIADRGRCQGLSFVRVGGAAPPRTRSMMMTPSTAPATNSPIEIITFDAVLHGTVIGQGSAETQQTAKIRAAHSALRFLADKNIDYWTQIGCNCMGHAKHLREKAAVECAD
ncbi:Dicer-like protein 1 [Sorochytrium milnesiophthora]